MRGHFPGKKKKRQEPHERTESQVGGGSQGAAIAGGVGSTQSATVVNGKGKEGSRVFAEYSRHGCESSKKRREFLMMWADVGLGSQR